jgi:hypothetical protein
MLAVLTGSAGRAGGGGAIGAGAAARAGGPGGGAMAAARGAGAVAAASPERRLHLGVVGRQLGGLRIGPARLVGVAGVGVHARQLLEHRDGLRGLAQVLERLGQHLQRVQVARIGLEADLQLGEGPLRIAAGEEVLGQLARQRGVRLVEVADALGHAEVVVGAAVALQVLGGAPQLGDRLDGVLLARVLLAQPDAGGDVVGIEVDQLLQGIEAGLVVAGLLVMGGDRLPLLGGVADEAQLLVQLGQADVDLDPLHDLQHLFVERDGLQVEALRPIGARHLLEAVRGFGLLLHLLVELGQLLEDADVVRVHFQDALVFLDGLLELTFDDQLGSRLDDLVLVHRSGTAPSLALERAADFQRNVLRGYIQGRSTLGKNADPPTPRRTHRSTYRRAASRPVGRCR